MSEHHHHDIPTFTATEVIVREDILAKAQELAALITTSDEVRVFREAEHKVNGHAEVQDIIKQIKKKQKEIVGFEYFKNDKMVQKIESEIEDLETRLNGYPIVWEFKQTQEDINYLLQLIIGVIRDTVSEKISVEAGAAAAPSSCSD